MPQIICDFRAGISNVSNELYTLADSNIHYLAILDYLAVIKDKCQSISAKVPNKLEGNGGRYSGAARRGLCKRVAITTQTQKHAMNTASSIV